MCALLEKCGYEVIETRSYSRRFTLRYLFERVGFLKARTSENGNAASIVETGMTIPLNFGDAMLVVARKRV
jgi:hypothetical protein